MNLADYSVLSCDGSGTLIDWEAEIVAVMRDWAREQELNLGEEGLLVAHAGQEAAAMRRTPSARYPRHPCRSLSEDRRDPGPAENHFRALDETLNDLGVPREGLLHVAQSLFHDHVPARRHKLSSVWINRRHDRPGWGAAPEPGQQWSVTPWTSPSRELQEPGRLPVEGGFPWRRHL